MRIPLRAARRLALAGLAIAAGLALAPAPGMAAVPSEQTLPKSTVGFLKVANAQKLRAAIKASQFGQLIADPAMEPVKADFKEKLKERSDKLKEKIGVTLEELATLPQGEVTIALLGRENNPKAPVAIFISADAGDNAAKMADVLAKSTKLAEEDATVTTETFKDLKLTVLRPKKEEEKDNPPLVWTQQKSVFYIASDVDALKDVLSHAAGREDSLGSSETFAAVRKKAGDNAQIGWFVDVAALLKLVGQANGGAMAGQIEQQLQLTGLDSLKGLGGSLAFNVGDFDTLNKIIVLSPGEAKGLLKIFAMPKANLRPQPWVPATIASYQSFSWDLDKAYSAINDLANGIAPGMLANLEKSLGGPDGNSLSFEKDVFGPLGNRITVLSDLKKGPAPKPAAAKKDAAAPEMAQRYLFAVALDDAKAFQTTFNKLVTMTNQDPKKRDFQGTTIYDFEIPEVPNPAGGPAPQVQGPISVAIAKDNLFLASDPAILEQVLRGGGQGLAETAAFQSVAKAFPPQSSTLSFQRPEEQARAAYDMIKSGAFKKSLEQAAKNAPKGEKAPDPEKVGDVLDIDPAKLPDFSIFAKYLAPGGGYGVGDEDGITFTQFTIKKAAP